MQRTTEDNQHDLFDQTSSCSNSVRNAQGSSMRNCYNIVHNFVFKEDSSFKLKINVWKSQKQDCSFSSKNGVARSSKVIQKRKYGQSRKKSLLKRSAMIILNEKQKYDDLIILIRKKDGTVYATPSDESRFLGKGGYGIVYKGFKIKDEVKTPVAIKVISNDRIKDFVEDEELGFVPKEVFMMNQVKGHPNAIQLIDFIQMSSFSAIIMERPENCKDLFEFCAQQISPSSENDARKVIKQLSNILLTLEKKSIVHRDVKAENVLLDLENGQIKLIDFGLATTFNPGVPMRHFSGTRDNTPPEYVHTGEYQGPDDTVWTLGLILYSLVCGDDAFSGMADASTRPVKIPTHLSTELKDLLLGMLRKNPERRLTLEQVRNHSWMTRQTNSLCLPFGYRRSFRQKYY